MALATMAGAAIVMTAAHRRVLLIAYHFPPMGGSGVQRPLKFARYLPCFGWTPAVLCGGHGHYPHWDPTLCDELPPEVQVERCLGFEPAAVAARCRELVTTKIAGRDGVPLDWERRLYWRLNHVPQAWLPDTEWLWTLAARRAARRLVRRLKPEVVITTGPPHATHAVGASLKNRLKLPWIADLRDPITTNFEYAPGARWRDAFWRRMESTIAAHADAVVVTCDECGEDFMRRHPEMTPDRMITITNGFDPGDFAPANSAAAATADALTAGTFVLRHVGAFYGRQTLEHIL
ncbi:MAG: glycosyltransferase, partial [Phycisphaerae bacterium]